MKILPYSYKQKIDFKSAKKVAPKTFGKDGDLTNAGAYSLTCLLTSFAGIQFAKKGFKEANFLGKIGKIAGGMGVTVGLAVPLFAIFKLLNIIGRPNDKIK